MSWHFKQAIPMLGSITERPAWDGRQLFLAHGAMNRALRLDPQTEKLDVFREDTQRVNGLNFNSEGRLFACENGARRIARYDPEWMTPASMGTCCTPEAPDERGTTKWPSGRGNRLRSTTR